MQGQSFPRNPDPLLYIYLSFQTLILVALQLYEQKSSPLKDHIQNVFHFKGLLHFIF